MPRARIPTVSISILRILIDRLIDSPSCGRWMQEGEAALAKTLTGEDRGKQNFSQWYQPRYGARGRCVNCYWGA